MKTLLFAISTALLLASCNQESTSSDVTTETPTATAAFFGEEITEEGAITPEQLLQQLEAKDSVQTKLIADVMSSCTKKGCWMKVQMPEGVAPMHVNFKDYGFFVPVDTLNPDVNKGKKAVMEGWAYREVQSVEDQRHYAEDAGKSQQEIAAISEPKTVLTFEASGVILKQ